MFVFLSKHIIDLPFYYFTTHITLYINCMMMPPENQIWLFRGINLHISRTSIHYTEQHIFIQNISISNIFFLLFGSDNVVIVWFSTIFSLWSFTNLNLIYKETFEMKNLEIFEEVEYDIYSQIDSTLCLPCYITF